MKRSRRRLSNTWRDRFASRLANAALRLASSRYRELVGGAIEYGLRAAARDEQEGRASPPPWREGYQHPSFLKGAADEARRMEQEGELP